MNFKNISQKVWKIYGGSGLTSNVYLVDVIEPTLIDLGSSKNHRDLIKVLRNIGYETRDIINIVFTHLHPDHTGKPSRFKNATFFASAEEIKAFKENPYGATIFKDAIKELNKIQINPLKKNIAGMEVIKTPGHTIGSVCLYLKKDKILFTGDTWFGDGVYGRIDLQTSVPEKMESSIKRLMLIQHNILCPGH